MAKPPVAAPALVVSLDSKLPMVVDAAEAWDSIGANLPESVEHGGEAATGVYQDIVHKVASDNSIEADAFSVSEWTAVRDAVLANFATVDA